MTEDMIMIPFPKALYDDVIRFSDGEADPVWLARSRVQQWVEDSVTPLLGEPEIWGERLHEVAEKYAPHAIEQWEEISGGPKSVQARPLVWKEILVPAGSDVRMYYNREQHYAKVADGKIVDGDQRFTPNEWASKVARGTSRNAWDAVWFREPHSSQWISANTLREQARERHRSGSDA